MSDQRIIESTFWVMVVLQTIGSIDMPGAGARKMPAPRQYVAIVVLWAILGLAADTGLRRPASRFALLLVLVGMVLGPFGQRAVSFLNTTASLGNAVNTQAPTTTAATVRPRSVQT